MASISMPYASSSTNILSPSRLKRTLSPTSPNRGSAVISSSGITASPNRGSAVLSSSAVAGNVVSMADILHTGATATQCSADNPVQTATDQMLDERDAEIERLRDGVAAYRRSESRMAELVYRLQQQMVERDAHISALEERDRQQHEKLSEQERQYREDMEDRDQADLVHMLQQRFAEERKKFQLELDERDQKYQADLEERDAVYNKDLEERDAQYQEDLESLKQVIADVRAQSEVTQRLQPIRTGETDADSSSNDACQKRFNMDLEATCKEGDWQAAVQEATASQGTGSAALVTQTWAGELEASARNLEAIASSRDAELKELQEVAATQATRILELEAREASNPGETEAQLRELHDVWSNAAETEAQLRELQQLAVAREAHIADVNGKFSDLEINCSAQAQRIAELEEQLAYGGNADAQSQMSAQGISDMEAQLGKLLELASARITELEGQQETRKTGQMAEMESQLRELKEVAISQAAHIAALEAQDAHGGHRRMVEADILASTNQHKHMPDAAVDSEESTSAGSGHLCASDNIETDLVRRYGLNARGRQLSPMPQARGRKGSVSIHVPPMTPTTERLVKPNPPGEAFSPTMGGSLRMQTAGLAAGQPRKVYGGSVLVPATVRREVSPVRRAVSPARPLVREASPLRPAGPVLCTMNPHQHPLPDGNQMAYMGSYLPRGGGGVTPAPVMDAASVPAMGALMSAVPAPVIDATPVPIVGTPVVYSRSHAPRGASPTRPQPSTIVSRGTLVSKKENTGMTADDEDGTDKQIALGLSRKLVPL